MECVILRSTYAMPSKRGRVLMPNQEQHHMSLRSAVRFGPFGPDHFTILHLCCVLLPCIALTSPPSFLVTSAHITAIVIGCTFEMSGAKLNLVELGVQQQSGKSGWHTSLRVALFQLYRKERATQRGTNVQVLHSICCC